MAIVRFVKGSRGTVGEHAVGLAPTTTVEGCITGGSGVSLMDFLSYSLSTTTHVTFGFVTFRLSRLTVERTFISSWDLDVSTVTASTCTSKAREIVFFHATLATAPDLLVGFKVSFLGFTEVRF